MERHKYLGKIGIISFVFGTIQLMLLVGYPMIGYLLFEATGGSYRPESYRGTTPIGAHVLVVALFAISIGAFVYIRRSETGQLS